MACLGVNSSGHVFLKSPPFPKGLPFAARSASHRCLKYAYNIEAIDFCGECATQREKKTRCGGVTPRDGVEPSALRLTASRSNQLSYRGFTGLFSLLAGYDPRTWSWQNQTFLLKSIHRSLPVLTCVSSPFSRSAWFSPSFPTVTALCTSGHTSQ